MEKQIKVSIKGNIEGLNTTICKVDDILKINFFGKIDGTYIEFKGYSHVHHTEYLIKKMSIYLAAISDLSPDEDKTMNFNFILKNLQLDYNLIFYIKFTNIKTIESFIRIFQQKIIPNINDILSN